MGKKKRPGKAQLVYEHLENVSATVLKDYLPIIGTYVRGKTGIYALYSKKRLYYVGLATNLIKRLPHHFRDRHANNWDRFSIYLTKDDKHLQELETLAIHIASPQGNRANKNKDEGKFVRSENLRRRFKRDFREYQRKEIDGVFVGHVQPIDTSAPGKAGKTTPKGFAIGKPLSEYVQKNLKIHMPYKRKTYRGVIRKDGVIRCEKGLFASLSGAATAIAGKHKNGWHMWKYRDKSGNWQPVANLRKRSGNRR